MRDSVTCPACCGTGRRALSPKLQSTLDWLRRVGPKPVGDVARAMRINHTAANERLATLKEHDLVARDPDKIIVGRKANGCRKTVWQWRAL